MNIFRPFDLTKPPMHLATLFGIPIQISSAWCIMVAVITLIGVLFGGPAYLIAIPILFLVVYFFIVVHEYGHALTAEYFGIKCKSICLYPFAGVASINIPHDDPKKEFWITLNGPLTNFVWCILFLPLMNNQILSFLFTINLTLLLFNLLPVHPMDGGRLFRSLIQLVFKISPIDAAKCAYYTGMVVGAMAAVVAVFMGYYGAAVLLVVAAFFLGKKEYEMAQKRETAKIAVANYRNNPQRYIVGAGNILQESDDILIRSEELLRATKRFE